MSSVKLDENASKLFLFKGKSYRLRCVLSTTSVYLCHEIATTPNQLSLAEVTSQTGCE